MPFENLRLGWDHRNETVWLIQWAYFKGSANLIVAVLIEHREGHERDFPDILLELEKSCSPRHAS